MKLEAFVIIQMVIQIVCSSEGVRGMQLFCDNCFEKYLGSGVSASFFR